VQFLALSHQVKIDLIGGIYKYVHNTYLFNPAQVLSLDHMEHLKLVNLNIFV
jgi:hypothetical protein